MASATGAALLVMVARIPKTRHGNDEDKTALAGAIPGDRFGQSLFPRIGTAPYLLTLGPHAFYGVRLRRL